MVKLKAGALQLTLFISVVIALLLSAFVVLMHTHKQFNVVSDFTIEAAENTNKGITYALTNTLALNDTTLINLNDEDYKTLKAHRSFWGVFEKVTSYAKIKSKQFQKIALVGGTQTELDRTALYIQDNNKPLVLAGKTRIQGLTYLPKKGVKSGNISGQSYYGERFIYGPTKKATTLPIIAPEIVNYLKRIQNTSYLLTQNQFIDTGTKQLHKNSFLKPAQYILSSNTIALSNVSLIGHIVVKSERKIIVNPSAILKDIILIAPNIEIKDRVTGTFQAIATKTINVGKQCKLNYPSALVLNESKTASVTAEKEEHTIQIGNHSKVNGVVIFLGQNKINNTKTQVVIDESTVVKGEVYCNQNLELRGTVQGTVFTSNFMANQFGFVYQNHIYNGRISVDKLPEEYIGLQFTKAKKGVAKWLY